MPRKESGEEGRHSDRATVEAAGAVAVVGAEVGAVEEEAEVLTASHHPAPGLGQALPFGCR